MNGTFTRKIDPHQKCSSSQPPVIGPMATPSPATPAQAAMACARSLGSVNRLVMIDRVAGITNAAPTPMRARVAISAPDEPEKAASTEPMPKTAMPANRDFFLPKRSPRLPAESRSPAKTRT